MNIVLTLSSNDQGISWGPAVHFLELWNAFVEEYGDKYHIEGFVPTWTGMEYIKAPMFKLTRFRVPNIPRFRQIIFDLVAALRILNAVQRLIYIRVSSFHLFSIVILKLTGKSFVVELNGISQSDSRSSKKAGWFSRLSSWQECWLIRNASMSIAVSNAIAKNAQKVGARTVRVIKNSVNPDLYRLPQRKNGSKIIIIYVGTYTSWDGSDLIPDLARDFPDVQFLMVGEGVRKEEIEKKSPENMTFVGAVPYKELYKYYKQADAGIALYEEERHKTVELSSIKVQEFMAAGLPIFSTDVPGQEFIRKYKIGKLVSLESIKEGFACFLQNLQLYKKRSEHYRNTIGKSYGWRNAAQATENALREVGLGKD